MSVLPGLRLFADGIDFEALMKLSVHLTMSIQRTRLLQGCA
jgi:hypothetical protein